jgi:hypothetical protein
MGTMRSIGTSGIGIGIGGGGGRGGSKMERQSRTTGTTRMLLCTCTSVLYGPCIVVGGSTASQGGHRLMPSQEQRNDEHRALAAGGLHDGLG